MFRLVKEIPFLIFNIVYSFLVISLVMSLKMKSWSKHISFFIYVPISTDNHLIRNMINIPCSICINVLCSCNLINKTDLRKCTFVFRLKMLKNATLSDIGGLFPLEIPTVSNTSQIYLSTKINFYASVEIKVKIFAKQICFRITILMSRVNNVLFLNNHEFVILLYCYCQWSVKNNIINLPK